MNPELLKAAKDLKVDPYTIKELVEWEGPDECEEDEESSGMDSIEKEKPPPHKRIGTVWHEATPQKAGLVPASVFNKPTSQSTVAPPNFRSILGALWHRPVISNFVVLCKNSNC